MKTFDGAIKTRKLRPLSLDADRIAGTRTHLAHIEHDYSMDDYAKKGWPYECGRVHHERKEKRLGRDLEKRSARHRMKTQLRLITP